MSNLVIRVLENRVHLHFSDENYCRLIKFLDYDWLNYYTTKCYLLFLDNRFLKKHSLPITLSAVQRIFFCYKIIDVLTILDRI